MIAIDWVPEWLQMAAKEGKADVILRVLKVEREAKEGNYHVPSSAIPARSTRNFAALDLPVL